MYMPTVICTFSISNRGVAVVHHDPVWSMVIRDHSRLVFESKLYKLISNGVAFPGWF